MPAKAAPVDSDTIYALASGSGRAGVAVVRLSGPAAKAALAALVPDLAPRARFAHHVKLIDPADGRLIDAGLALVFPAPASFTGEDVVELHTHGSPAVLERLFHVLQGLGLRAARAGEFSRRAFAHGKMDLTAAEGLADLIESDSDQQRVQALNQMGGAWAARIGAWQSRLLDALAWVEAGIDFTDEEDVPDDVTARARQPLAEVAAEMAGVLADSRIGEITRDGLRVAIIGPPNVGKSTLLNALAGRDAAIVSPIAGTTRDIIEVRLNLEGHVVVLADMAGLRDTDDPIESEGVRRARSRAAESDLRVFVTDGSESESLDRVGLEISSHGRPGDILFLNKADRGALTAAGVPSGLTVVRGSALTSQLGSLLDEIGHRLKALPTSGALITRARHREALSESLAALRMAELAVDADFLAEHVRHALQALSRILGRFDIETVLDRIFSSFCIGK